jgi:hypothetical protein
MGYLPEEEMLRAGNWLGLFRVCEAVENIVAAGSIAVSVADLAGGDDAVLVDEKGGGVCGFVGCIPAQAVLIGDLVLGVDDEMKARRKRAFFRQELLSPFLEISRRAGETRRSWMSCAVDLPALISKS